MQLSSVTLEHTNPSKGPREVKTSFTLQTAAFETDTEKLLAETKVNNTVSLSEYLSMLANKDYTRAQAVRDAFKPQTLPSGGTISNLKFTLKDNSDLEINDLRTIQLDGYYSTTFFKLRIERGAKFTSRRAFTPKADGKPRPVTDEEREARQVVRPGDLPE